MAARAAALFDNLPRNAIRYACSHSSRATSLPSYLNTLWIVRADLPLRALSFACFGSCGVMMG